MKFGVVVFPGSNCDQDLVNAIERVTKQKAIKLWHKETNLQEVDFVFLPGGFSYGDYLRSGSIAKLSPIMQSVVAFANKGFPVMGICNGFQILCESGLLPGALLRNTNQKFICQNSLLKVENTKTILTSQLQSNRRYKIPIAHGEGRFFANPETIASMEAHQQILFRYVDDNLEASEQANPNGSVKNIAGICNTNKNVFGMMPHPERAADLALNNQDGEGFFLSILHHFEHELA
ncbi:MAG: phosphoribosylformylglycinamidine synthase I [Bacteroidetes bacterium MED-G17]|nr:MAG: phosphoribosylformylglycinamidine synthase I [Bacteroidetes bacterium TMED39]PDH53207.1 MAG: phosphoribosylformylglycinamidine synthase I [Bacteroidetes bacterium MED-G17]CAI8319350.1 MAG: Phosphoribosylformylglycinamidine synthase subunit PurQ [Bacteroidetes bacterium MED-G17]|tara:strand:+ start:1735 stop:2436 length:702 start_codon:yes stop_codon:yes gene_type:complete